MAYEIGTARGIIEMEYNGRGIDQAKEDLGTLDKSGESTTRALTKVSTVAAVAGAAVAAGLYLAVKSAANFEQRMSAVEAVSGASADEMDRLSQKALQLGKDTAFSATDAAQAIEELVKAGLSVDDVLNGAADATVNLAAAGEIALPQAAEIAANAMNQFGLKGKDMVNVADQIAGAANASAIDVSEFGQSLQQAGAVANLAGLDFNDTATAIALMGNAGIKGSDAGTSLKTFLSNLQPVTQKQIALFKELGLVTEDGSNKFYDAAGNIKDLGSVSQVLQNSLKGMTAQQKQMALETAFGSDAIRAAAILSNQGAKGFDNMANKMAKVSAAEVAAKRLDNFNGKLETLKGSLETAGIAIGGALLPALTSLVNGLTSVTNWFLGLSSGMQKFIAIGAATVAAVLLIAAGVIKMIILAAELSKALAVLRLALAGTWLAALGPIGLIIAAIVLVVAAIVILWKKSETFRDIVIGVWEAIKGAALAVANWFTGTLVPALQAVWDAILNAVKTVLNAVVTAITTYVQMWVNVFKTFMAILRAIWTTFWGIFGGIIKAYLALVLSVIKIWWTIVKGVFLIYLNIIKTVVRTAFNIIKTIIVTVLNVIKGIVSAVWGAISGVISSAVGRIKSVVSAAWGVLRAITQAAFEAFRKIIWDKITAAMQIIGNIEGRIRDAFAGAIGWLVAAGAAIIQGLINGIESMLGKLKGIADKVGGVIGKILPGSPVQEGPLKVLNRGYAGKQIVQMVIDGLLDMTTPLSRAADKAFGNIDPGGFASPGPGATPKARRGKRRGGKGQMRMVEGELRLDRSGRAFISGVASDEVDDSDDYDDTLERMG